MVCLYLLYKIYTGDHSYKLLALISEKHTLREDFFLLIGNNILKFSEVSIICISKLLCGCKVYPKGW